MRVRLGAGLVAAAFLSAGIALATAPSARAAAVGGVTFASTSYVEGDTAATWTVGFTPSGTGALSSGNAVVATLPSGFDVSAASAAFGAGFTGCGAATTVVNGQNVIVQLGPGCALGAGVPATVTITGISPQATQYAKLGFSVTTYADTIFTTPIDGSGGHPPTFIEIFNSVTYSALTSGGSPTTGGGAPSDPGSPYSSGATVTVLGNAGSLALAGDTFAGWCTVDSATDATCVGGTHYDPGDTFTIAGNVSLYSQWTPAPPPPTFSVTYDGNGATGGTVPVDATAYPLGSAATVRANVGSLVMSGYAFGGWNTLANGTGASFAGTGSETFPVLANVTFYAQWTQTPAPSPSPPPPPTCNPGTYLRDNSCVNADPGYFVSGTRATSETPCAAGTYAAKAASTSCPAAQAGYFVSAGQTAETPCAADTFSVQTGSTSCAPCPSGGTTLGKTGQTICAVTLTIEGGSKRTISVNAEKGQRIVVDLPTGGRVTVTRTSKGGKATTVCTITVPSSGTGFCALDEDEVPVGSYQLKASYAGAANVGNAAASQTLVIRTGSSTAISLTASNLTPAVGKGQDETFTVKVTGNGAKAGTSIDVTDGRGGPTLCSVTLDSKGLGHCTPAASKLTVGSHSVAVILGKASSTAEIAVAVDVVGNQSMIDLYNEIFGSPAVLPPGGEVTLTCGAAEGDLGKAWGSGPYTLDSAVCAAAANAGVISPTSGGTFVVKIVIDVTAPAAERTSSYGGSTYNGVTTLSWAASYPIKFYVLGATNPNSLG
jgi:hypothetical protein